MPPRKPRRPIPTTEPIRSASTEVAYRICEFANGRRNCTCKNHHLRTPCESLKSIAKECVAIARVELKRKSTDE
ncbi:hypothetical protein SAMN04515647_3701 [Cohaesibacter sp. ES.047]|nr:hypothetical protein SAMN04515647_3701 [Cohaesibacter sp. ES.047]